MHARLQSLALASTLLAAAALAEPAGPKTERWLEPVFVPAGPLAPREEFFAWLDTHPAALVRVPVTLWGLASTDPLAVGFGHQSPPDPQVGLSDARLGVSLRDRARHLCEGETPCTVWLVGTWREAAPGDAPLAAPAPASAATPPVRSGPDGERGRAAGQDSPRPGQFGVFRVAAVGPRVASDAPARPDARFQVARAPACLAIRTLPPLHCARGASRCKRCAAAARAPAVPSLLDLCPEGEHARPTVAVVRDGVEVRLPWDLVQTFPTAEAARAFADLHGLHDVAP
jgi:hypothetical protein